MVQASRLLAVLCYVRALGGMVGRALATPGDPHESWVER